MSRTQFLLSMSLLLCCQTLVFSLGLPDLYCLKFHFLFSWSAEIILGALKISFVYISHSTYQSIDCKAIRSQCESIGRADLRMQDSYNRFSVPDVPGALGQVALRLTWQSFIVDEIWTNITIRKMKFSSVKSSGRMFCIFRHCRFICCTKNQDFTISE